MKKALFLAAALGVLSLPAFSQGSQMGAGTSSGGPGRMGIPGQVDGGVPGQRPNVGPRMSRSKMTMQRRMMRRKAMRRRM